jgi:hypothetical protein
MSQVGFETTNLVFELAKTVHALDRAASVMGTSGIYVCGNIVMNSANNLSTKLSHTPQHGPIYWSRFFLKLKHLKLSA